MFWPRRVKGQGEDAAVRTALREIAREALALENMLAADTLWGREPELLFVAAVERAAKLAEMQWGAEMRPAREALAALRSDAT